MIDASTVKQGDRIGAVAGTTGMIGTIDMATDEGNFVRVQWDRVKRPDILSRTSPLWCLLELAK